MGNSNTYKILDNRDYPFKVHIEQSMFGNNKVSIYLGKYEYSGPKYVYKPSKVFIGKSSYSEMTSSQGEYGPELDGNSILLELEMTPNSRYKYVYIGAEIYEFESHDQIWQYESPVGNNSVPYPYGIDTFGNYYLFQEKVIVQNLESRFPKDQDNPYRAYWELMQIYSTDSDSLIQNFWSLGRIKTVYVGAAKHNLIFSINPNDYYDTLLHNKKSGIKIVLEDGKVDIDRQMFIDLIHKFGEAAGIYPFLDVKMIERGR